MKFENGGYLRIIGIRIFRAAVFVHWSALVAIIAILAAGYKEPIYAFAFASSYFGVIFLHECGYAFFATRLGCQVHSIRLTILHGACEYQAPWNEREDLVIAWGSVLVQLAVAIPLIGISLVFNMQDLGYLRPVVVFLGYFSVALAIVNLAPSPILDGYKAWKLIPILVGEFNAKSKNKKEEVEDKDCEIEMAIRNVGRLIPSPRLREEG